MEITRICPACYLLRVPDAGISWVFNAWPDLAKFLIQQELAIDGIVYPDLRMQSDQGISCNLICIYCISRYISSLYLSVCYIFASYSCSRHLKPLIRLPVLSAKSLHLHELW